MYIGSCTFYFSYGDNVTKHPNMKMFYSISNFFVYCIRAISAQRRAISETYLNAEIICIVQDKNGNICTKFLICKSISGIGIHRHKTQELLSVRFAVHMQTCEHRMQLICINYYNYNSLCVSISISKYV